MRVKLQSVWSRKTWFVSRRKDITWQNCLRLHRRRRASQGVARKKRGGRQQTLAQKIIPSGVLPFSQAAKKLSAGASAPFALPKSSAKRGQRVIFEISVDHRQSGVQMEMYWESRAVWTNCCLWVTCKSFLFFLSYFFKQNLQLFVLRLLEI